MTGLSKASVAYTPVVLFDSSDEIGVEMLLGSQSAV